MQTSKHCNPNYNLGHWANVEAKLQKVIYFMWKTISKEKNKCCKHEWCWNNNKQLLFLSLFFLSMFRYEVIDFIIFRKPNINNIIYHRMIFCILFELVQGIDTHSQSTSSPPQDNGPRNHIVSSLFRCRLPFLPPQCHLFSLSLLLWQTLRFNESSCTIASIVSQSFICIVSISLSLSLGSKISVCPSSPAEVMLLVE